MTEKEKKNISKFISKILRHRPEIIGMRLDEHGWADADELVAGVRRAGHPGFDREKLDRIVEEGAEVCHLGVCTRKRETNEECEIITAAANYLGSRGVKIVRGTH